MKLRGRPKTKIGTHLMFWLLVELMRDRENRPERHSVRAASDKLADQLSWCFSGHLVMPADTIRDHYKRFEQNSGTERADAERLLELGRARRADMGWKTTALTLITNREDWEATGFDPIIHK